MHDRKYRYEESKVDENGVQFYNIICDWHSRYKAEPEVVIEVHDNLIARDTVRGLSKAYPYDNDIREMLQELNRVQDTIEPEEEW